MILNLVSASLCIIALLPACGGKQQAKPTKIHAATVQSQQSPSKEIDFDKEMGDVQEMDLEDTMLDTPTEDVMEHETSQQEEEQPVMIYEETTIITDGDIDNLDPAYTFFYE